MSAAEKFQAAMTELREETAKSIQQHRTDAKALADMTAKLDAALQGQVTDVDVAALAGQIHDAAQDLANGIAASHTDAVSSTTANASTSKVDGGTTAGPDVVSASSPGTIVPQTDAPNSAVPESLGGGAMPRLDATDGATAEKAPEPAPEGGKVAEPAVPSVEDVPSKVTDNAPDSAKKD